MWRFAALLAGALALSSCGAQAGGGPLGVFGERFTVQGNSMEPAVPAGTTLTVQKSAEYKRGDVVAVESPQNRGAVLVRRIVGLPGETLEIVAGVVLVEGAALDEPYARETDGANQSPVNLDKGQYYVLADNRRSAADSRAWGPVPAEMIRGVAKR